MATYYKAKHILISEEDDLDYVLEQINDGVDFETLANEYSECDTAENGGNLGRFPSGTMLPEFEKALFHMKVGEVKSGVKTKFGYHIILRLE
jgi:peptidyl-prolyl cis-trans isomerase C